jgi:hypothetical protein
VRFQSSCKYYGVEWACSKSCMGGWCDRLFFTFASLLSFSFPWIFVWADTLYIDKGWILVYSIVMMLLRIFLLGSLLCSDVM